MDRHEVFWFDQAEHEFLFLLPPVSRSMDVVDLPVNDIYTRFGNRIDQFIHTGCISRNRTRREDHGISWLELHLAVRSVGNPREGCHWLSLASCTHNQDFIGRIVFDLIWLDNGSSRDLDIAKLDSVDDGFFHRASKDDDLTTCLNCCLSSLLKTEDIRSKGSKNDAPVDAFDDLHNGLANHFFRVGKGWDFCVG